MTRTTGWVMVGMGLAIAAVLYALNNPQSGPKVPTRGSGQGGSKNTTGSGGSTPCNADVCGGVGLDGSADPVIVSPQSQTEAAYQDPTDYSDAFGDNVNDQGDEIIATN